MSDRGTAERRLDELYAALPKIVCRGLCVASCGPILMSKLEASRVARAVHGHVPAVTGTTCPLLEDGRCTVYPVRPIVCRLWGMTEGMECPHGCERERVIPRAEAMELIARAEAIGGGPSDEWLDRVIAMLKKEYPDFDPDAAP